MKSRKVKAYNARKKPKVDLPIEDSDDDNVNPDSFFHDEIEDFNNAKDDELSTDDELIQQRDDSSEEEEILPISDEEKDESDSEKVESGDDDEEEEEDLPNREAWGKKKSTYYSADFVDQDRGRTYWEQDAEAAKAEEEEALAIQKSVYSNINADNLGANLFFESDEEAPEENEKIDINSATKEERLRYIRKETNFFEYRTLLYSSLEKLKICEKLCHLVQTKQIKSKQFEQYVQLKKQILSLIIHNICIYFMLASKGLYEHNPKHHPVNQRISQFKQVLDDLESADQELSPAIDDLLKKVDRGEEIIITSEVEDDGTESIVDSVPKDSIEISGGIQKIKKPKTKHLETETEKEVISLRNQVKEELRKRKLEEMEADESDNDETTVPNQDETSIDGKRIISYQIAKNKGLVPHRKKEYRNPRVLHRKKYRKAQIRRKGQVRGVVKEIKRYEGEPTGISSNVVKSRKFK